MAKILFFNVPAYGHVNVTIPMTHELAQRGHEVIYYCTEQFRTVIESTGATFRLYPTSKLTQSEITQLAQNLVNVSVLLTSISRTLTPFVIDEIDREQPDLILHDIITLWARIGAYQTKTPTVATYSVMILEDTTIRLDIWSGLHMFISALPKMPSLLWHRHKLIQAYGSEALQFPLFPSRGDLNLVFLSRDFQMDTPFIDSTFRFVGASINPTLRKEPPLTIKPDERPLIFISLGTVNNNNIGFYQRVIEAFDDARQRVVLSVGTQVNIQELGTIPKNITVSPTVPQLQVLQQADVFVTHGGMNSVQESIYYGVPMVVVPQQLEQMINGRRAQELGVGIVLGDHPPYGQVTVSGLRNAVDRILLDTTFRKTVTIQQKASQSAGGYQQAVDEIESALQLTVERNVAI